MRNYIVKRILQAIPIIIGISFISFLIIQLSPGDFLSTIALDPQMSPDVIEQIRQDFGLNKPILVQYILWLKNIFFLDFGYSFSYRVSVSFLVISRLGNTLILSLFSMFLAWLLIIP